MHTLYPLKFVPILKQKVWGGQGFFALFQKGSGSDLPWGESWELSGVPENVSVVQNGFLKGNNLADLLEVYMGDLVGEKVFATYGSRFPLLVKLIDTREPLSVQVHPDDAMAIRKHGYSGKSEMWYVIHAEPGAEIFAGFNRDMEKEDLVRRLEEGSLREVLNVEKAVAGDVFYIPSGRIHAIGAGITLCEIQQSSDITYRIYDWGRTDAGGQARELHTALALEALDYKRCPEVKTQYEIRDGGSTPLVASPHFTTNLLTIGQKTGVDHFYLDSFVVYVCLEGALSIDYGEGKLRVGKGETVLMPAEIKTLELLPEGACRILETYIA